MLFFDVAFWEKHCIPNAIVRDRHELARAVQGGWELGCGTLLVTIVMEIFLAHRTAMILYKKQQSAYLRAIVYNFVNHLLIGMPIYALAVTLFCRPENDNVTAYNENHKSLPLSFAGAARFMGIVLVHNYFYYAVHQFFHTAGPQWYRHHKFHHQFTTHVSPMVSNAVSLVEYYCAYVMPFAIGSILIRPKPSELYWGVAYVAFTNLLVHTPVLSDLSMRLLPRWLSTTGRHLEHHWRLNVHYAAPVMNVDYIVERIQGCCEYCLGRVSK